MIEAFCEDVSELFFGILPEFTAVRIEEATEDICV
jgi:hypothetical protein